MRGRTPNNETGHIEWENTSVQRGLLFTFRLFPLIRPGLRPVHLPRRGRRPPAGDSSGGGVPLPSPGGRWPPQRPEEGRYQVGPCTAPHPALRGHPLPGEGRGFSTPGPAAPVHPLLRRGFFQAIYASRSESFLTIREVMRNSTATKAKKPHWALVVSEVAMKS